MTVTREPVRVGVVLGLALAMVWGLTAPAASAAVRDPKPGVTFQGPPERPARYVKQVTCDPVERPGTAALRQLLKDTYGRGNSGGITRSCSTGGASEHKDGRAYDWSVNVAVPEQKQMGDHFVGWLTGKDGAAVEGGNAHRLGVQYVIWNKRIWNSGSGWKAYYGAVPHTDHVHVSLSWDGAMKRTSWWTGTTRTSFDYGPCQVYTGEPAPRYAQPRYSPCPDPVPRIQGVVTGDFDGDGRTEVGTYRNGVFALRVGDGVRRFAFGRAGDVPVAGDWDGDGVAGIGVFRAGNWYLRNSLSSGPVQVGFRFGTAGDTPVVGRWAAGRVGVGVKRGSQWYLRDSVSGGSAQRSFGWARSTDTAVVGDWDGDGRDTVGVRRGNGWTFSTFPTRSGSVGSTAFGSATDRPVVGDWDGNRRSTPGVVRLGDLIVRSGLTDGSASTGRVPF